MGRRSSLCQLEHQFSFASFQSILTFSIHDSSLPGGSNGPKVSQQQRLPDSLRLSVDDTKPRVSCLPSQHRRILRVDLTSIRAKHTCEGVASRHIYLARRAAPTRPCPATAALPQSQSRFRRKDSPVQPSHFCCIWTQQSQRQRQRQRQQAAGPAPAGHAALVRRPGRPGRQGRKDGWWPRGAVRVHVCMGVGRLAASVWWWWCGGVVEAPLMNLACVNVIPGPDHTTTPPPPTTR